MRGVANIVIGLIILLIFVPIFYIIGGYIVNSIVKNVDPSMLGPNGQQVIDYILTVWDYLPIIMIMIGILWAIAKAMWREGWTDVQEI